MDVPRLRVVVVTYQSGPCIEVCIERLLQSEGVAIEVVLVDNASADDTVAIAQSLADADGRVRLVRNADNRGFAAACNQGAAGAETPWLLFLNPDCFVEPDALGESVAALQADPAAAAAGALVCNPDGQPQRGCRRRLPDPMRAFYHLTRLARLGNARFAGFNEETHVLPAQAVPVEAISGSYLLIRRADFEQVGGWDEGYFLHCEDLDLCQRLADLDRKILFVPAARATHLQGVSSRRTPLRVEWHKHRGMWRFYRKFQARRYGFWVSMVVISGIVVHFAGRAAQALWGRRR